MRKKEQLVAAYAAWLYGERKLTLERAASEAGIGVREMMEYGRAKRVPGQYELSDLEEDTFLTEGVMARKSALRTWRTSAPGQERAESHCDRRVYTDKQNMLTLCTHSL